MSILWLFGRQACASLGALTELRQLWHSVAAQVRSHQVAVLRDVTALREMAFLGLLVTLLCRPGVTFAYHLSAGVPGVGYSPPCRVFRQRSPAPVNCHMR